MNKDAAHACKRRTIYGSKSFDRNAIESDKYNDDVIVVGNTLVTTKITKS